MTQLFAARFQALDANGNPYSGAKLYFYQSGTTTAISVYQDAAKATPHASPVVADTTGTFAEIFIDTDPYKYLLTTSAGVNIETVDAVPLLAGASGVGADLTDIEAKTGTGILARWASNSWTLRTVTAGNGISVTNGDGVAGNPTVTLSTASTTEVLTGTDTVKAVTPDALAALWEKGSDVASDATISLGEGGVFHITGTTTITDIDFGTAKNGRRAWLIFDGALILTHNATTLILPGAANITTAANDRALVYQDSSDNVYVLAYIKADGSPIASSAIGGMTLLGTLTTTSGTTQSLTSIASGYRYLWCEIDGVSFTSNVSLTVATSSSNGAAYGTAGTIVSAVCNSSNPLYGSILIHNISSTIAAAKIASSNILDSAGTVFSVSAVASPTNTAAVVDAIRFAGGTFDAGTIRVYGVK